MLEFTFTVFKKLFVACGIAYNGYPFAGKEFDSPTHFRIQALGVSLYLYLDTTDGMAKRALAAAMGSFKRHMDSQHAKEMPDSGVGYIVGRA